MRKIILKGEKGLSLIVLMITLILMAILIGVVIKRVDIGTDIRNYNLMCADIELLETKVSEYYAKNGALPGTGSALTISNADDLHGQASSRDIGIYRRIDISKLSNVSLNYGGGTTANKDIYIMDWGSREIYYLKGTELDGQIYHRKK